MRGRVAAPPRDIAARFVRIALLVRLFALGLAVVDITFRGPDTVTLLLLVALSVTSFAGLKSAALRALISRRPLLAVPDLLLVSAVPLLIGDDSPLSLVSVSSALVIGVLFPLSRVIPLFLILASSQVYTLWPIHDALVDAVRLPMILASVTAMGVAFRHMADRQAVLEQEAAEARVVEAAARERLRVARDVHDTVAKACQGVALTAAALPAWIERDVEVAAGHARSVATAAREALATTRSLLTSLRLDDPSRPLGDVVADLALRAADLGCLTLCTDLRPVPSLAPADRHELVWAVSEALHNVIEHAPGSTVRLRMVHRAGAVWVFIADDGPGFSAEREVASMQEGHFGLTGMRERLASLGGRAEIRSRTGGGTRVTLAVPVDASDPIHIVDDSTSHSFGPPIVTPRKATVATWLRDSRAGARG